MVPSLHSVHRTIRCALLAATLFVLICPPHALLTATPALADDDGGGGDGGGSDGGGDGGDGGGNSGGGGNGGGGSDDGGGGDGGGNSGGGGNGGGDDHGGNGGSHSGESSARGRAGDDAQLRDGELAARYQGKIASVRQIQRIANKLVPGDIVDIRLRQEGGVIVYRIKIIEKSGNLRFLKINATTQKLISAR